MSDTPITSFPVVLTDADGFDYDITNSSFISDGTSDAFDGGFAFFDYSGDGTGTLSENGREVNLGQQQLGGTAPMGLLGQRSIYVSDTLGYARFLDTITNTSSETVTYTYLLTTNLGSDGGTVVEATSNANTTFETTDTFITTDDGQPFDPLGGNSNDPHVTHILHDGNGLLPSGVTGGDNIGFVDTEFTITLQPGESTSILSFGFQSADAADAQAQVDDFFTPGNQTNYLEGLSVQELKSVANFEFSEITGNSALFSDLTEFDFLSDKSGDANDFTINFNDISGSEFDLVDADNFEFDIERDGEIGDGANLNNDTSDAFDGGFSFRDFADSPTPDTDEALVSEDGRELNFDQRQLGGEPDGLLGERSVYVSDTLGYARFLDTITNTTGGALTYTYLLDTNLGSDDNTQIEATGDGNVFFSANDTFITTSDGDNGANDPVVTHVLNDGSALLPGNVVSQDGDDDIEVEYTLTLEAGESASILSFGFLSDSAAEAQAHVDDFFTPGNLPNYLEGLSTDELARVQNFDLPSDLPAEAEIIFGDGTNETLNGSDVDNIIVDNGGNDDVFGLGGDDTFIAGTGVNNYDGGDGFDLVDYSAFNGAINVNLATQTTSGGGAASNDTITGIEGIIGTNGNDILTAGNSGSTVLYSRGVLETILNNGSALNGGAGNDSLIGSSGDDLLIDGDGNDTVNGNDGNDVFIAGTGANNYNGGVGNDTIDYSAFFGTINVNLATGVTTGGAAGNDTITNIENIIGTQGNDVLRGDADDNTINGFLGNDTIFGEGGNDAIDGGDGDDIIHDGAGNDTNVFGGAGNDIFIAGAGLNSYDGGDGADYVDYSIFNTAINANLDTGVITGGAAGNDTFANIEGITGTNGNDILTASNVLDFNTSFTVDVTPFDGGEGGFIVDSLSLLGSRLDGAAGNDTLIGGIQSDLLLDGAGSDDVFGGGGNDFIVAGTGANNYDGGASFDTLDYSAFVGAINVNLDTGVTSGGAAGNDIIIDIERLFGTQGGDTLSGGAVLLGGAGNDILSDADRLHGGDGNDTLTAQAQGSTIFDDAGNDIVNGGIGADRFIAGTGANAYDGGGDNDTLDYSRFVGAINVNLATGATSGGAAGNDTIINIENIVGTAGGDTITGDAGTNQLEGFDGNDTLSGGGGDDELRGGDGDDIILDGSGNDEVFGEGGNDLFVAGGNANTYDGGDGFDTVDFSAFTTGITIDLEAETSTGGAAENDTLTSIEGVIGTNGNDDLTGRDSGAEIEFNLISAVEDAGLTDGDEEDFFFIERGIQSRLDGGNGDDMLFGGDSSDLILDGAGDDDVFGNRGSDIFIAGTGANNYDGGSSFDVIDYSAFQTGITVDLRTGFTFAGAAGNDTITDIEGILGTNGDDTLFGDSESLLFGGNGNDFLFGGGELIGAAGNDTLINGGEIYGGDGNDIIALGDQGGFADDGAGNDQVTGGNSGDTFLAGTGANSYDGGDGDDELDYSNFVGAITVDLESGVTSGGAAGNDTIINIEDLRGTAGNDTLRGNTDDNVLEGRDGNDGLSGRDGDDTLDGNDGNDRLFGGDGSDELFGGDGEDFLDGGGGEGVDSLFGGDGADVFHFDRGEGTDVIEDFELGIDTLEFDNFEMSFTTAGQALVAATQSMDGDVIFDFGADGMVTVEGVTLADLEADIAIV